ncbi:WD40 repeat domain-containing serine/threonine protein kinase [Gymnodinialimonas ceratoperidinii]|uniref:non-specific serine/threonine protein kinase n=1 Tax=Gymnodinialimonas ceratoperidinii TaxID=2856823 RepID=A0A8F6TVY7_9RHOB|nr:WD40 repeat domain-containing serine/threonine protein kinase [Gymnodinialimonas ceratoperidinii]QXT38913.1 protein kinase [Gymnodinialimonas ceratoperidinii]
MAETPSTPRGPDAVTHLLPAGELPAGWTLLEGQYEIVRLIASGGFGITYLARDTLGRDVAVKECFPLGLAQRAAMSHTVSATSAGTSEHFETARAQFLREANMLAGLRHPNVVHVQSLFEENGTAYMAMDFIHGRDLNEEIEDAPLPPERVLSLARELLGALDYVHAQGVLHRDIKPQNIRIDTFGKPKLIDFGAARAETQARSRMAGTFRVVTDGYSPHEFYVSGAKQGPHSDLYALAATLHHLISGAAPVAADERASAMATGQPDPYQPIAGRFPDHDPRLLHLIDRALRMVPEDRPANAAAWLTALTDAPISPESADAPAARGAGLAKGVALGALLAALVGAGIWAVQPPWLTPGMEEMQAEMAGLSTALADATTARETAANNLIALEETLASAQSELARLEAASGDMTATLAELDAAREARDAAARQIADLQAELTAQDALAEELLSTQAQREAALSRAETAEAQAAEAQTRLTEAETETGALTNEIETLEAEGETTRARVNALEASLAEATSRLVEARTTAALLARAEADLSTTEAALNAATIRAATLDAQLDLAVAQGAELEAVEAELRRVEGALETAEAARLRLSEEIAALENAPLPNLAEVNSLRENVAELERENRDLQGQLAELEASNDALTAALTEAEAALSAAQQAALEARGGWEPQATLRAPNGTFALLPRFSWDNRRIAAVDSTGGIALYDRRTGTYEAHLARGIPDRVVRLGFSPGGAYLIATTPEGAPNRLYDVRRRREILRFEPVTVTTANRAISTDEQFFVYTRASENGIVNVVNTSLAALADPDETATERVITSVPAGTSIRVAFSETRNEINVLTPSDIRVFAPDGTLLQTAPNQIGAVAALAPIGEDQGFLVLHGNGDVRIYDNLIAQNLTETLAAQTTYATYRLSGDRLNFLRAGTERWEVIDLLSGTLRGTGPIDADTRDATLSLSADGQMIFIGATETRDARLLDVATGLEIQNFGDAAQGYFSFDNSYLATGRDAGAEAQIWRMGAAEYGSDLSGCTEIDRAMEGIPILPNALERRRNFSVAAGGSISLTDCLDVQDPALRRALSRRPLGVYVSRAPDVAIDILGTGRDYAAAVSVEASCAPTIIARFGDDWRFAPPGAPLRLSDSGRTTRALDVWLATPEGVECDARITLAGNVEN